MYLLKAYDSVWRPLLFKKLKKLGFGGKTLKLIKSMYQNDSLKFLINGHYTMGVFLTLGLRQGKKFRWSMQPVYRQAKMPRVQAFLYPVSLWGGELHKGCLQKKKSNLRDFGPKGREGSEKNQFFSLIRKRENYLRGGRG